LPRVKVVLFPLDRVVGPPFFSEGRGLRSCFLSREKFNSLSGLPYEVSLLFLSLSLLWSGRSLSLLFLLQGKPSSLLPRARSFCVRVEFEPTGLSFFSPLCQKR